MDGADEQPTLLKCAAIEITYVAAAIRNASATFWARPPSKVREEWAVCSYWIRCRTRRTAS